MNRFFQLGLRISQTKQPKKKTTPVLHSLLRSKLLPGVSFPHHPDYQTLKELRIFVYFSGSWYCWTTPCLETEYLQVYKLYFYFANVFCYLLANVLLNNHHNWSSLEIFPGPVLLLGSTFYVIFSYIHTKQEAPYFFFPKTYFLWFFWF